MIVIKLLYLFMFSFTMKQLLRKKRSRPEIDLEMSGDNCIITNKHPNGHYCNKEYASYLERTEFIQNKSLIAISPGGFKGFYLLGVSAYLKEHYSLENYIYTGASAGAWNSLFLSLKINHDHFIKDIVIDHQIDLKKMRTPRQIEHFMKRKILSRYSTEDFDLRRVFFGVTSIENFKRTTNIYTDFNDLEDAIDCCIASSHIPLLTGGFSQLYHNKYCFDGGFSKYPYLNSSKPALYITPSIFKKGEEKENFSLLDATTLFSRDKYDFGELYQSGYNDASTNRHYLDTIFTPVKLYKR